MARQDKKFVGLIVDDDEVIRKGVVDSVDDIEEIAGVVEATDGQDALKKVRNQHFDFMVIDLMMPKMGGLDFLRHAFKEERIDSQKSQIIVLSGNMEKESFKEVRDLGVKYFLVKPCDVETITKKLVEVLKIGSL